VKGCQRSNQEVLAPSFLRIMYFVMMVFIGMSCCFLVGRGFRRLGSWLINTDFKMSKGLLGSFARVLYSKILCAFYCPTSSQFQPISFRKHEKGMSSSDSISLSHLLVRVWGRRGVEIGK